MAQWITTLYTDNTNGLIHTMEAETKEEVIAYIEGVFEMKYVYNEYGTFLTFFDVEPNFEKVRNCYSIAIGKCNENGFAHDAVQW